MTSLGIRWLKVLTVPMVAVAAYALTSVVAAPQPKEAPHATPQQSIIQPIGVNLEKITVETFLKQQQQYRIVDVRPKKLYEQSHIVGAINIPFDEIDRRAISSLLPGEKIAVYCDYRSNCEADQEHRGVLTQCQTAAQTVSRMHAPGSTGLIVASGLDLRVRGVLFAVPNQITVASK